ncbi:DUF4864 domain-containing protein [Roseovarius sp. LXJ103]|uniref:DUF4864 domain-containing protein n=1 Tax=Roseovarius carneus TaxID=2853164 RepID=UPI000D60CC4C|nr:DUF4864 domain-containing protein [Roseovarius carneus]MBZ8118993.1 DUF4864 domain-containing protein [Roseovarius carneus]PWE35355.1 DUF4864 domain-containing protein [Pelagicola sp. LXJ1103]
MRFIFAALVALFTGLSTPQAMAQESDVRAVIAAQIEAFEADDFEQAFTYASPTIRQVFRTPENFGVMVQRGFPMVWRPADVRFLELENRDGALWQDVMVRDVAGDVFILEYEMIELDAGWKINGVRIRPAVGTA